MRYSSHVADLVGSTPLVRLSSVTGATADRPAIRATVLAKVEYFNPGGSAKDRIARSIIDAAERDGLLRPGGTIVEATSGNTGVGLALIALQRGYRMVFVVPDKFDGPKVATLRAFGAEVVVTPTSVPPEHPESYYSVAARLAREIPPVHSTPQPVREPERPARALRVHRTGDLGRHGRARHALRRRHRHGRHDQRHRTLPQGGQQGPGARDRRGSGGIALLRRSGALLPRRRRRGRTSCRTRSTDPSSTGTSASRTRSRSR